MEHFNNSSLIPLYDRKAEWEYRIRMIQEANSFIYTSTYFLHYDSYGIEYMNELLEACKRGVKVTIIIDRFGQALASNLMDRNQIKSVKKTLHNFTENGGIVIFYKCKRVLQKLLGSGIHIKIQLSDAGGAIFSSGNISDTSYNKWQEFAVYCEGDITLRLLEEFSYLGANVDKSYIQHLLELNSHKTLSQSVGYISYNPTLDTHWLNPIRLKSPNIISDYLVDIFYKANERICLTSFYFKPAPTLVKALIQAARRGVKVEIFHSHRDALGVSIAPWLASFHLYKSLIDAGVDIYENKTGEHSKIILVDDKIAIFGSYNLEYAAHDRLAEAMMVSTDAQMLAFFKDFFIQLKKMPDNIKVQTSDKRQLSKSTQLKLLLSKHFTRWI